MAAIGACRKAIPAGFAWSPNQDITFTADYWQFDHKKIIGTDLESMLVRTLTDPSLRFCGLVPSDKIGISFDPELCDELGLVSGFDNDLSQVLADWQNIDSRATSLPLFRDASTELVSHLGVIEHDIHRFGSEIQRGALTTRPSVPTTKRANAS